MRGPRDHGGRGSIDESTNRRIDESTNRRIDESTNRRIDGSMTEEAENHRASRVLLMEPSISTAPGRGRQLLNLFKGEHHESFR